MVVKDRAGGRKRRALRLGASLLEGGKGVGVGLERIVKQTTQCVYIVHVE